MTTDDRFRASDADRDRVAARLREHFAEGRITREELDERLTVALKATTYGDLRRVLADLPEPAPALVPGRPPPRLAGPYPVARRGPRLLPLALLALVAALALPGAGWLFVGVLKVILLFWLVGCVAAMVVAARFGRLARQHWHGHDHSHDNGYGHGHGHGHGHWHARWRD
jgi:hypothetical protein